MNDKELLKAKDEIEANIFLLKKMSIISFDMYRKLKSILKDLNRELKRRKLG